MRRKKPDERTDPCQIAGCIYSALYIMKRPILYGSTTARVCRKCAGELHALHGWTYDQQIYGMK